MTTPIGIPYGTRLVHIEREATSWIVWTAINQISAPRGKRLGTYLELSDTGSVTKVTIHPDGTESTQRIKGDDQW